MNVQISWEYYESLTQYETHAEYEESWTQYETHAEYEGSWTQYETHAEYEESWTQYETHVEDVTGKVSGYRMSDEIHQINSGT